MKHLPITIKTADLMVRVFDDSDWDEREIADYIGLDYDEQNNEADWSGSYGQIWVVSWPDHVLTPGFNRDATYSGPYELRRDALEFWQDATDYDD